MFIQINCDPEKSNAGAGRSTGQKDEVRQLNKYIDLLQAKIHVAQMDLLNAGMPVTALNIKNKIQGIEEREKTVLEVYNCHNKQFAELVGKEFAIGKLKKCKTKGSILPTLSNQKMNSYLKEIADACGINKMLTFHIARHTFATTITLNNGTSIEAVSDMSGHSSLKQTQHYSKVKEKLISGEMQKVRNRYHNSLSKVKQQAVG